MFAATRAHLPISLMVLWDEITADDVGALRSFATGTQALGQRHCAIVDVRHAKIPPSPIRRALADLGNDFSEVAKQNTICAAMLIDSRVLVGAWSAIRWFLKPNTEFVIRRTASSALDELRERLAAEGLAPTSGIADFLRELDGSPSAELGRFNAR